MRAWSAGPLLQSSAISAGILSSHLFLVWDYLGNTIKTHTAGFILKSTQRIAAQCIVYGSTRMLSERTVSEAV